MALNITTLATSGGVPYIPSSPPTVSVWSLDGTKVATSVVMTQVGSTSFYYYDLSTNALFAYGTSYVYQTNISGQPFATFGTVYQDAPDRTIGTVTGTGPNSASSFTTTQTETTANYWYGSLILFLTGSLKGQVQTILGYTPTNGVISVFGGITFTSAPTTGDKYVILNF